MKIWVTGAEGGMLGYHVMCAVRAFGHTLLATGHGYVDIANPRAVVDYFRANKPDVIINCAGALPGTPALELMRSNAMGPHLLATMGVRVVHMSTDCVFSGVQAGELTSEYHRPDPIDAYGRSKLAGEVQASNVLNVRGSFIGKESGLLHWILNAKGHVPAYKMAYWNGTSVSRMAEKLVELAETDLTGVVHVASPQLINKATIVAHFQRALHLPFTYEYVDEPRIWRVLHPDIETASINEVLDELVEEIYQKVLA